MPDEAHPTIGELQIRSRSQKGLDLQFHSLVRSWRAPACSISVRGSSTSSGRRRRTTLLFSSTAYRSLRRGSGRLGHPPRYAAFLKPPSSSFDHSSLGHPDPPQHDSRVRDLAMFNVAIDSKLRVYDIHLGDSVRLRTTVVPKKTERPMPFELVAPIREALAA